LGWEAFNEPVVLKQSQLDSFHEAFADGVHAIDADAPVLFEPVGTRNQTDSASIPYAPWSHGPGRTPCTSTPGSSRSRTRWDGRPRIRPCSRRA
jgi:hypothetical protein